METFDLLHQAFKEGVEPLRQASIEKYLGQLRVREEFSSTPYAIERIADIIFLHALNEDFYGYVFSLTIKTAGEATANSVEVAVIQSDGPIIELSTFDFAGELSEDSEVFASIKSAVNLQINSLLNLIGQRLGR